MANTLKNADWDVLQQFSEALAGLGEMAAGHVLDMQPTTIDLADKPNTNPTEETTQ